MNVLELANVSKHYMHSSGPVRVLTDVTANVVHGQTIAVLGPSGSGKSTLLALLAGLDSPDAGIIRVMERDMTALSEAERTVFRAKTMGIVFQQFHLLGHFTALENVMLPLQILGRSGEKESAKAALASVGLGDRADHYPHELSGGECQRVAIARAFIAEPPLILADEPSGNLDHKTGETVMRALFTMVKERKSTLILVTHNQELATWCDRIFDLGQGTLKERGV